MPWANVIKLISDSTLFEPEDVRLVLQRMKEVGVAELRAGRNFNFNGARIVQAGHPAACHGDGG